MCHSLAVHRFKGNEYKARLKSRVGDKWVVRFRLHGKINEMTTSEANIKPWSAPQYKVGEYVTLTYKGNEYKARLKSRNGDKWVARFRLNSKIKETTTSEATLKPRPQ